MVSDLRMSFDQVRMGLRSQSSRGTPKQILSRSINSEGVNLSEML